MSSREAGHVREGIDIRPVWAQRLRPALSEVSDPAGPTLRGRRAGARSGSRPPKVAETRLRAEGVVIFRRSMPDEANGFVQIGGMAGGSIGRHHGRYKAESGEVERLAGRRVWVTPRRRARRPPLSDFSPRTASKMLQRDGPSAARRIAAAERRDRAFVIARDVMTGGDHEMRNNSAPRVAPGRGTRRGSS